MRIELRRNVRIESNRKVPQTNRLSLGVLEMDGRYCIYHVKFNVCLVTKPLGVFSSETKWLNASLLFLRMNYVKNV